MGGSVDRGVPAGHESASPQLVGVDLTPSSPGRDRRRARRPNSRFRPAPGARSQSAPLVGGVEREKSDVENGTLALMVSSEP